ncbi:MFS transporter [Nocardioides maradonensis]
MHPADPDSSPPTAETGDAPESSIGHSLGTGARATGRGLRRAALATGRFGRYTARQARKAADAQGAATSGLNRLIEVHAANAAGDAAITIALAGTVFFKGATSDARGQVALFLGLTMLPFAIVAPLIGPFLDRFSHGRRWAIGVTFALRAFLCWVLAGAIANDTAWFYPAALGVLVSSKAYGIARAAAVPRLLPSEITLVKANGRVALAGLVGAGVSAPLAGLASLAGPEWDLRYGFVVFVIGTILAIRLPSRVDSSAGETGIAQVQARPTEDEPVAGRRPRRRRGVPPAVAFALRVNCGPRFLSGFLTMYFAFVLREHPVDGWTHGPALLIALVIGSAGLGNTLGIITASLAKRISPAVTVVAALAADIVAIVLAAVFYNLPTLVLLGVTAGLAQYLAKVSLDSTIQTGVPATAHASAFARGDTTLQFAWVIGGFVGIALPMQPNLGLGVASAALLAWAVTMIVLPRLPKAEGALPAG